MARPERDSMSQAKVDKYKEYKKNRKKNIAKEKRQEKLAGFVTVGIFLIVILAVALSLGKSFSNSFGKSKESLPGYDYVAEDFVLEDYAGVIVEE